MNRFRTSELAARVGIIEDETNMPTEVLGMPVAPEGRGYAIAHFGDHGADVTVHARQASCGHYTLAVAVDGEVITALHTTFGQLTDVARKFLRALPPEVVTAAWERPSHMMADAMADKGPEHFAEQSAALRERDGVAPLIVDDTIARLLSEATAEGGIPFRILDAEDGRGGYDDDRGDLN